MAAPEPQSRAGEYLTFSLGVESYGVDILQVQEIIGMPRLTRLPRAPEYMLGVMNLRGMVVPVLDMRLKLNLTQDENSEAVVVVLRVGDKIMGAVVDSVRDVVQLAEEQIQTPPDFAGGLRRDYLRGLCHLDDQMIILLELDRLLAQEALSNAA
ncbi:MAG: purine-binding chemotaxis protein CheW [Desulfarculus sp.]|nr:purine-binding chemotaxis protein CheW [Desulfarculus sp.]